MSFGSIIAAALTRICESDRRYREYRRIAELDQQRLDDIGLSREQLETATLTRDQLAGGIATIARRARWITPD